MPRKHWRDRISNLALCLAQLGVEDEVVGERLDSRRLAHRNSSGQFVVPLDVSMALGTNCVARPIGNQPSIALFGATVCPTPDVINLGAFGNGD